MFKDYPTRARNKRIYDARLSGKTLDELAKEFGLSRERVRQVVFRVDDIINRACKEYFAPVTDPEVYGVWHTFTHDGRRSVSELDLRQTCVSI